MNKEILEGNKLIAEFMGLKPQSDKDGRYFDTPDRFYKYDVDEWKITNTCTIDTMLYHSSLDWIFSVVNKIESKGFRWEVGSHYDDPYHYCRIWGDNPIYSNGSIIGVSMIDAVYGAVVEFIKWYNKNK